MYEEKNLNADLILVHIPAETMTITSHCTLVDIFDNTIISLHSVVNVSSFCYCLKLKYCHQLPLSITSNQVT